MAVWSQILDMNHHEQYTGDAILVSVSDKIVHSEKIAWEFVILLLLMSLIL